MILRLNDEKSYTYKEVYEIVNQIFYFVNHQINGEFSLKHLRRGNWLVEYNNENAIIRESRRKSKEELKRTADYIQELTGRRPAWG